MSATVHLPLGGGCQCGAVRYEVRAAPQCLYACHCTDCQRQSSSAYGLSLSVPRQGFAMVQGQTQVYVRATASGRTVAGHFCPACGTRLYHAPSRNTAIVNVKAGTLDDARWLKPAAHVWTSSAQAGTVLPAGVLQYPRQPDSFDAINAAWAAQAPLFS